MGMRRVMGTERWMAGESIQVDILFIFNASSNGLKYFPLQSIFEACSGTHSAREKEMVPPHLCSLSHHVITC
jgi:hypothetical protein